MSKTTASAASGAMPAASPSRRRFLGTLAVIPALAVPAIAVAAAATGDAELIALEAQLLALNVEYDANSELIRPHDEEREVLRSKLDGYRGGLPPGYLEARAKVDAFDVERGLDILHERQEKLTDKIIDLQDRMFEIPVTTDEGRRIKVRTVIKMAHCRFDHWRGPSDELDFSNEVIRGLLGEYAGLSEAELAAI